MFCLVCEHTRYIRNQVCPPRSISQFESLLASLESGATRNVTVSRFRKSITCPTMHRRIFLALSLKLTFLFCIHPLDLVEQRSMVIHTSVTASSESSVSSISSPMSPNGSFATSIGGGGAHTLTAEEISARQAMAAEAAAAPPAAPPTRDSDISALTKSAEAGAAASSGGRHRPRLSGELLHSLQRDNRTLLRTVADVSGDEHERGKKGRFGMPWKRSKKEKERGKEKENEQKEKDVFQGSITATIAAQVVQVAASRTQTLHELENSQSRSVLSEMSSVSGRSSISSQSYTPTASPTSSLRTKSPFSNGSQLPPRIYTNSSSSASSNIPMPRRPLGSPRNASPTNFSVTTPVSLSPTDSSPLSTSTEPVNFLFRSQLQTDHYPPTRQHSKTLDNVSPPNSSADKRSPQSNDSNVKRLATMTGGATGLAGLRAGRTGGGLAGLRGGPRLSMRAGPPPRGGRGGNSKSRTLPRPRKPPPKSPRRFQNSAAPRRMAPWKAESRSPKAFEVSKPSPATPPVDTSAETGVEKVAEKISLPRTPTPVESSVAQSSIVTKSRPPPTRPPPRTRPQNQAQPSVANPLSSIATKPRDSISSSTSSVEHTSSMSGSAHSHPSAPWRSMSITQPLRCAPSPRTTTTPPVPVDHDSDDEDCEEEGMAPSRSGREFAAAESSRSGQSSAAAASTASSRVTRLSAASTDPGRTSIGKRASRFSNASQTRAPSRSYSALSDSTPAVIRAASLSSCSGESTDNPRLPHLKVPDGATHSGDSNAIQKSASPAQLSTVPKNPQKVPSHSPRIESQHGGHPTAPNMLSHVTAIKTPAIPTTTNVATTKSIPGPRRPAHPRLPSTSAPVPCADADSSPASHSKSFVGNRPTVFVRSKSPKSLSSHSSRPLPRAPARPRKTFTRTTPRSGPPLHSSSYPAAATASAHPAGKLLFSLSIFLRCVAHPATSQASIKL